MNLQAYIDAGWFTVPLQGQIIRHDDGTKTAPRFEVGWKAKYAQTKNFTPAQCGGVLTGEISGIVAIDCDDQATLDMFLQLAPPKYPPVLLSKGKPKGGGTILFAHTKALEHIKTFSIQSEYLRLDFFSDNGFIYLATKDNGSKHVWPDPQNIIQQIIQAPATVITLLTTLATMHEASRYLVKQVSTTPAQHYSALNPLVTIFVDTGKFSKGLFRVITPKEFRTETEYRLRKYLHPNTVPKGSGSRYLSQVSAILGADPSIDKALYYAAIQTINKLWDQPMSQEVLESTITNPMLNEQANVDGEIIWRYDKYWYKGGLSLTNKLGEAIELFYDDKSLSTYCINYSRESVTKFNAPTEAYNYLATVGSPQQVPKRVEYNQTIQIIRAVSQPNVPFGLYEQDEHTLRFNLFLQSPCLAILSDPTLYEHAAQRPTYTLDYLATLIPDEQTRNYVLRFIRKKLTTFAYSPIILYFLGVPGSGKDTFIKLLAALVGEQYIAAPTASTFLENHNGWIEGIFFAHLDEYGDQLTRQSDKQLAVGKLKAYTGKSTIQLRTMGKDGTPYEHRMTPILTANSNPLVIDEKDRRIVLIDTPTKLDDAVWVRTLGGISELHKHLKREVEDFAYYLATEVDDITDDEYVTPHANAAKQTAMVESMSPLDVIVYSLKNNKFQELEELCIDHDTPQLFGKLKKAGKVDMQDVNALHSAMTEGMGNSNLLSRALKCAGMPKVPTNWAKKRIYVIDRPAYKQYRFDNRERLISLASGFVAVDSDDTDNKDILNINIE